MATETEKKLTIKTPTSMDPREIVVYNDRNYSRFEEHPEESIIKMAVSFASEGNLVPVQVRRIPGDTNRVELILGYRRWLGAMKLVEGFDWENPATGQIEHVCNPDFRIQVINAGNVSDAEMVLMNYTENHERVDLTPMDQAKTVHTLLKICKFNHVQIATKMQVSPPQVYNWDALNSLSADIQRRVHTREMSMAAALKLAKIDPEEAKKVVEECEAKGEKVTMEVANRVKRSHNQKQAAARGVKPPKETLSVKEIKGTLEGMTGHVESPLVRKVAEKFQEVVSGQLEPEKFVEEIDKQRIQDGRCVLIFLKEKYEGVIPPGANMKNIVKAAYEWDSSRKDKAIQD